MATPTHYNYEKEANLDRLTKEIKDSTIVTVLESVSSQGSELDILFKDALSNEDVTTLEQLVQDHVNTPLPDTYVQQVDLNTLKDENGCLIMAPTLEHDLGLTAVWKGYSYSAQPGALNFFDQEITNEIKLRGGWYEILEATPALGDYIEFSVIDKNDVLGYFQYFGLTVGVDVLELRKFVRTNYIKPGATSMREYPANSASNVVAGLFFRTTYHSVGQVAVPVTIVVHYLEE